MKFDERDTQILDGIEHYRVINSDGSKGGYVSEGVEFVEDVDIHLNTLITSIYGRITIGEGCSFKNEVKIRCSGELILNEVIMGIGSTMYLGEDIGMGYDVFLELNNVYFSKASGLNIKDGIVSRGLISNTFFGESSVLYIAETPYNLFIDDVRINGLNNFVKVSAENSISLNNITMYSNNHIKIATGDSLIVSGLEMDSRCNLEVDNEDVDDKNSMIIRNCKMEFKGHYEENAIGDIMLVDQLNLEIENNE